MATKHVWGNLNKGNNGGSDKFYKLKAEKKNRFRPLGDPVVFYRYYVKNSEGKTLSAITDDPDNCPVAQKHGETPRKRAAVNVIDRADGKLKILEGPYSLFADINVAWDNDKVTPGSGQGGDFSVMIEIPGGDKRRTRYSVSCNGPTPVTDEEKAMIKSSGPDGRLYNLDKEFAPTPVDQIEEKLGFVAPKKASKSDDFDNDSSPVASKGASSFDDEEMSF